MTKMLEDLEEVVRLSDRATSGTVELHTSCSWRRIVSGNRPFLVPTVDPDGHANMDTTASAEFVVSLVNWFRTHHATIRDMAARLEAAERDAGWISVKDRLPPKNGSYLIAYKWPGHGNAVYMKVTQFLHTAYDTKYMVWNEPSAVNKCITHWRVLPDDPDHDAMQETGR